MVTACQDAHGLMSGNNASAEQRERESFLIQESETQTWEKGCQSEI